MEQGSGITSFLEVSFEAADEYLPDVLILCKVDFPIHEVVGHFGVCEVFLWSLSQEHFTQNDANAPDIAFVTVKVLLIRLRTHVRRRADVVCDLRLSLSNELTKPKISNFGTAFSKENICCF